MLSERWGVRLSAPKLIRAAAFFAEIRCPPAPFNEIEEFLSACPVEGE
jgi:hypothetical protein